MACVRVCVCVCGWGGGGGGGGGGELHLVSDRDSDLWYLDVDKCFDFCSSLLQNRQVVVTSTPAQHCSSNYQPLTFIFSTSSTVGTACLLFSAYTSENNEQHIILLLPFTRSEFF